MDNILSIINNMNPYIRRAWDGRLPIGWELPKRIIFDFEIVYIMEGEAIVTIENAEYKAEPGDVFFFRPTKTHSMRSIGNSALRQPHIHFDFFYQSDSEEVYIPVWEFRAPGEDKKYMRADITVPSLLDIPDKISFPSLNVFEELIFNIIREEHNNTLNSYILKKTYLLNLIALIMMENPQFNKDYADKTYLNSDVIKLMEKARSYLIRNFNQDLSLNDIAKVAGFSKSYFSKLFKDLYHVSPVQFHSDLRIERAKNLLVYTNKNITEIAKELGFESVHTFSRAFKHYVSISPTQYRSI